MQKMKPLLSRALVAFLFALGLTLPVLGALDLMAHALPCAALLLGLCAILAAASLHRRVKMCIRDRLYAIQDKMANRFQKREAVQ